MCLDTRMPWRLVWSQRTTGKSQSCPSWGSWGIELRSWGLTAGALACKAILLTAPLPSWWVSVCLFLVTKAGLNCCVAERLALNTQSSSSSSQVLVLQARATKPCLPEVHSHSPASASASPVLGLQAHLTRPGLVCSLGHESCSSLCGWRTSTIDITWEPGRNADAWAPWQVC